MIDLILTVSIYLYKSLGYDLGDSIALNEYNKLRKSDNVAYSFGTIILDEILSTENKYVRKLTNSVQLIKKLPNVATVDLVPKTLLTEVLAQLSGHLL
mgnify:CR=1 FL=1